MGLLYRYYQKTNEQEVLSSINKSLEFMEDKVNEDGSYDYSNTSRKTQFLYPFPFAILNSDISKRITKGLENNSIINPSWLDDRYVIQLTTDYLETYLEVK